ncbi:histidine kinase N-terminal 7TM domain-containing protein [Natronobeatus ordinarius]|uniref:histidine kinase N-terminal 7TM domain-containing protein n=1 Tax=Natronobeatus ordinarius TaxID=2963433 RepID=UPI0026F06F77|nr:histidine kinase N-terminal 7TM domain-containing protein [Natronobeatus ordinarius]
MTGVGVSTPTVIISATTAVAAVFTAVTWRYRDEPGGRTLTLCLLVLVGWGVSYTLALTTPSLERTADWLRLVFATFALVPPLWLGFVVQYTGRDELFSRTVAVVLFGLPIVTAATALSPWFDPLLVSDLSIEPNATLAVSAGPILVATFVFAYLLMLFATLLLVQLFLRARHLYRGQAVAILAAAAFPWAGNVFYLTGVFTGLDLTGALFVVSAATMTLALARFRLLDPIPTGHRTVLERLTDGVVVLTDDWRIGDANPAARWLLDVDDPVGNRIDALLESWPFDRDVETVTDWRELPVTIDGETRFLEAQVRPFRDHHNRIVGRAVTLRDVTGHKRRELALERYETIYESIREPVFVLDADGRFSIVNDPFLTLLEADETAVLGERPTAVFDLEADWPADAPGTDGDRLEADVVTSAAPVPCEIELAPVTPSSDADTEGWVGVVRDVSRRKAAERDLAETAETLESVITASPVGVIACDREGTIELWNPAAESILGWRTDEAIGRRLPIADDANDPLPVVDAARLDRLCELPLEDVPTARIELELRRADDARIDASVALARRHGPDATVDGYVAVVDDITERKARERTLRRQNERLETFASVLSHDLRNPLAIATGFTEVARETGDVDELERVEAALDRMTEIVDDLLELARAGEEIGATNSCSLRSAARDAWETTDTGETRLEIGDSRLIEADRTRLVQLLENLFRNAVEHSSTSPRSNAHEDAVEHSSTSPRSNAHEDAVEHSSTSPDSQARQDAVEHSSTSPRSKTHEDAVKHGKTQKQAFDGNESTTRTPVTVTVEATADGFAVSDDGAGIPPDEREAVFERGYTTDADGTGLGLAIVREIAEGHGWTITLTESDAGGARFEFAVSDQGFRSD